MQGDPFYRAIRDALERKADFSGELFEECICDLLRQRAFPRLVPVSGGQDGGMDGAVADDEGEPFLLTATIQDNVGANLGKSLDSYMQSGGLRRKVILATSIRLTPKRRLNLRDLAREKGFTLVQLYEQRAVAALLYRSSSWCKSLLRLDGRPSALSQVPPFVRRPLVDLELRGRDTDLAWLKNTSGDRLLVAEPGAGKTYLFYGLATEDEPWGLFLTSDEDTAILNALRDLQPTRIFVDDAHLKLDLLGRLQALRKEVAARPFEIIAATWPDEKSAVQVALGLPEKQIRRLELLTRREILDIYRDLGIDASSFGVEGERVLGSLVDQASNRPGLAVTLGALWLEGDYRPLLRGEALRRQWTTTLKRILGADETELLGVISLAGRGGADFSKLKQEFGPDLRRRMVSLSAAGVLASRGGEGNLWAVQPQVLRSALLSEVFFHPEHPTRSFREDLEVASSIFDAAWELIAARHAGASVPREDLQKILLSLHREETLFDEHTEVWCAYARLGAQEAEWALEYGPEDSLRIVSAALTHSTESAVRALLEAALRVEESSQSNVRAADSPLQVLESWLQELTDSPNESVVRRRLLLRVARTWAASPRRELVAFKAACLALSPQLRKDVDAADGETVRLLYGLLPEAQMKAMGGFVEGLLDWIRDIGIPSWPDLQMALWGWLHPASLVGSHLANESIQREAHRLARKVLDGLLPLISHSAGMKTACSRLASHLSESISIELDPLFEALYPDPREMDALRGSQEELDTLVRDLAEKSPSDVATLLIEYHREATVVGYRREGNTPSLLEKLQCVNPSASEDYFRVFVDQAAPAPWIEAVLSASELGSSGPVLAELLSSTRYRRVGLKSALGCDRLPEEVNPNYLLEAAEEIPRFVWIPLREGKAPLEPFRLFLSSSRPELALESARALKGNLPAELEDAWRDAVLRFGSFRSNAEDRARGPLVQERLKELLAADADLAFEWLERHGTKSGRRLLLLPSYVNEVVDCLSEDQRQKLLQTMEEGSPLARHHLSRLVDFSPPLLDVLQGRGFSPDTIYQAFETKDPDDAWPVLAEKGLEMGLSPERIGFYLPASTGGRVRALADFWKRWRKALDRFIESSEHPDAVQVARAARQKIDQQDGIARGLTRQADLFGAMASH